MRGLRDFVRFLTVVLLVPWFGWFNQSVFGIEVEFSKQEFDLLELLMINKGILVSRDKVDRGHEKKLIKTIRGVGYKIR